MKLSLLISGILLVLSAPSSQANCNFQAAVLWGLADEPPIHATPSSGSEILGTAPRIIQDITPMEALFRVTAIQNGWVQVTDVTSFDGTKTGPDGWMDARLVSVTRRTREGYLGPSESSRIAYLSNRPLARVSGYPLDCRDNWVRISPDPRTVEDGQRQGGDGTFWIKVS
jgi:hypothetical protein